MLAKSRNQEKDTPNCANFLECKANMCEVISFETDSLYEIQ